MKFKIKDQFKKRYSKFEQSANWVVDKELLNKHFEGVKLDKTMKCLDVCCGTGIVGGYLKDFVGHVTGVDISEDMLSLASEKLDEVICSNATDLPFNDDSFDLVVIRQALHFTDNWQDILHEIYRVVKDNGSMIVSQIVPFNDPEDEEHLHKIHNAKQPLLVSFVKEKDLDAVFNSITDKFCKHEMLIEESIGDWLKFSPELDDARRTETVDLVLNAPEKYKEYHKVRKTQDDVYDSMRWLIYQTTKKENN